MSYRETRDLSLFPGEPYLNNEFFRNAMLEHNRSRIAQKLRPQAWMELTLRERHEVLKRTAELRAEATKEVQSVNSAERRSRIA